MDKGQDAAARVSRETRSAASLLSEYENQFTQKFPGTSHEDPPYGHLLP